MNKEIKKINKEIEKEKKKTLKEKIKNIDKEELKNKTIEKTLEAKDYYKNNTKKCIIAIIIIIFALAIAGKIFGKVKAAVENTVKTKGLAVEETVIELSDINNEIVYPAKIQAENSVNVLTKVNGEVLKVNVKLGDYVEKGQILFEIDQSDYQNSARAASASLQAASANYQLNTTESTDSTLNSAKVQFESAERNYLAAVDSLAIGGISQDVFSQAEAAYKSAKSMYEGMLNGGANAQSQASLAQLNSARATAKQANDALNNCNVKAPISGVIGSLTIKEHDMATAGYSYVTVVNGEGLEVELNVSESVVSLINKGDEVNVELNAFPDELFVATIDGVSQAAGDRSSTYPVVIKFDNVDNKIKSGMFGRVIFKTNKIENCIVIDSDAIVEDADEKFVFIEENNKAKKVVIETGVNTGDKVEVVSGLNVGDKLIIKGQNYLDDGDSVRVVEG